MERYNRRLKVKKIAEIPSGSSEEKKQGYSEFWARRGTEFFLFTGNHPISTNEERFLCGPSFDKFGWPKYNMFFEKSELHHWQNDEKGCWLPIKPTFPEIVSFIFARRMPVDNYSRNK